MENIKKLPVVKPIITSWQWHASLFSILSDNENAKKWIFSNYIQLRGYTINEIFNGDEILFTDMIPGNSSLKHCPYLIFSPVLKNQIENYCGNIIDFIIKTIDLGGYVYGVFDEAKILYGKDTEEKFPHELFIYGYNKEKKHFYAGDFTFADHYSHNTVSFEEVETGFNVVTEPEDHVFKDEYKGGRGLFVIFKNTKNVIYDIDIGFIKDSLKEYLDSKDSKNHYRMIKNRFKDTTFGINIYDKTLKQIDKQLHKDEPNYDIRPLHVLYDHKVLMYERIKYLMQHGFLTFNQNMLDEYETVVTNMLSARNLLLRISITGKIETYDKLKTYLYNAKAKEIDILSRIIENLKEN